MNFFRLDPDSVVARVRASSARTPAPSLVHSILFGGTGFGVVAVGVFATVAFAERWAFEHLGRVGAYGAWALLFTLAAGAVLSRVVIGPERVCRFYGLFGLAFFIYAGVWVGTYLSLPNKAGELLASVLGPSLLGTTLACGFEATNRIPRVALVLSLAHALGYFSGEMLYSNFDAPLGMLLWGVSYGVCYGSGIGYALFACQAPARERLDQISQSSADAASGVTRS